ncbi:MAG: hypothetical protein R3E12_08170 [Candidatus Eisenbacteria bacterium]
MRGGHVYRLPDSCDDFDLRVSGPAGEERVFALASYTPLRSRYPRWMVSGGSGRRDLFDDDSLYRTGWVTGDAVYEFGVFCERLVPEPRQRDAYSSAWVTFRVGGWHPVRSVCPVCGGLVDGGRVDGCVEVHWYADHGHIDFRADRRPIFRSWACGCSDRRGAVVIRIPSPHRDRDDHHDGHWGRDTDRHDRREVRGEPEGRVRRELGPDPKARSEGGRKAKGHDR